MNLKLKSKQTAGKKLQLKLMHSSYVLGQIVQTLKTFYFDACFVVVYDNYPKYCHHEYLQSTEFQFITKHTYK